MFPAPTTIATSTPRSRTEAIWVAIRSTSAGSVPYSRRPIRASPESFRRIRPNCSKRLLGADLEVREAGDTDVLAGFRGQLLAQLLDRFRAVFLGVDVLLVEQRDFRAPLAQLALDDFLDDVVRFAFFARLLFEDPLFGLTRLRVDFVGRDVLRRGRRDVQGDLVGEDLEVLVAGDEVGLALHLDHRADAVVGVDVGSDDALVGAAALALGGGRLALHPQQLDRAVDIAVGLGERRFAVHHRGPGAVPERLHVGGSD